MRSDPSTRARSAVLGRILDFAHEGAGLTKDFLLSWGGGTYEKLQPEKMRHEQGRPLAESKESIEAGHQGAGDIWSKTGGVD